MAAPHILYGDPIIRSMQCAQYRRIGSCGTVLLLLHAWWHCRNRSSGWAVTARPPPRPAAAAAVPILQVWEQKRHRCRALLGRLAALRQQGRLSAGDLAVWQAWWCRNCKLFGPLTKPILTGASAVAAWTAAVEVLRCDAISDRNSCAHSAIGVLLIFGWRWPDWLASMLLCGWRLVWLQQL